MVPSHELDRMHSTGRPSPDLPRWVETYGLTDVWRYYHPCTQEYTCHSATHKTLSRIDLVFASPAALPWVRDVSDHAPTCLTSWGVEIVALVQILDTEIQEDMAESICSYWSIHRDSGGSGVWWDAFKAYVRGAYISRISSLQKAGAKSLLEKEGKAGRCEQEFVASPSDAKYYEWQRVLRELSLLRIDQTKMTMLHSAQRVFEHGDKNGRLLAWLAMGQTPSTHIAEIRDEDGSVLTSPGKINAMFSRFFPGALFF